MRVDTLLRLPNTFEIHKAITSIDTINGEVTSWVYDRSDKGLVIPAPGGGGSTYLVTRDPINLHDAIFKAKDRRGTLIFQTNGEPHVMYVIEAQPQYDPFGIIVGWRHVLKRDIPIMSTRGRTNVANGT